jgi:integrase/recombinase XerD
VIKWSKSNRQWHLPAEKKSVEALKQKINSFAKLDTSILKKQLYEKKKNADKMLCSIPDKKDTALLPKVTIVNYGDDKRIHPVNAHIIPAMEQRLKLKAYSHSTIKTYLNEVGVFLRTIKTHSADSFDAQRIKDYLQ